MVRISGFLPRNWVKSAGFVIKSCLNQSFPWGAGADQSLTSESARLETLYSSSGHAHMYTFNLMFNFIYYKYGCFSKGLTWQGCLTENDFSESHCTFWKLFPFPRGWEMHVVIAWLLHASRTRQDSGSHGCWSGCCSVLQNFSFNHIFAVTFLFTLYCTWRRGEHRFGIRTRRTLSSGTLSSGTYSSGTFKQKFHLIVSPHL